MTTDTTDTAANDAQANAELGALLIEGRFTFLRLAQQLLDADLIVAWAPAVVARALEFKARGCSLGLEIFAGASGAAELALVAVVPGGQRVLIDKITEGAPGAVN